MHTLKVDRVTFHNHHHTILDKVSFTLSQKEFVALVGPNGAGKSTLLKIILRLQEPTSGSVSFSLPKDIAYVPQKFTFNSLIPLTVLEFLSLKASIQEFSPLIERFGVGELLPQSLHYLSGGQLQKVVLVFSLLKKPKLLLLDEATEGMDLKTQKEVLGHLCNMVHEEKMTILMVSHDLIAVTDHANRVLCINQKILFDGDPHNEGFHSCLHETYGTESILHGHHH